MDRWIYKVSNMCFKVIHYHYPRGRERSWPSCLKPWFWVAERMQFPRTLQLMVKEQRQLVPLWRRVLRVSFARERWLHCEDPEDILIETKLPGEESRSHFQLFGIQLVEWVPRIQGLHHPGVWGCKGISDQSCLFLVWGCSAPAFP